MNKCLKLMNYEVKILLNVKYFYSTKNKKANYKKNDIESEESKLEYEDKRFK